MLWTRSERVSLLQPMMSGSATRSIGPDRPVWSGRRPRRMASRYSQDPGWQMRVSTEVMGPVAKFAKSE